jgi:hypothetical protein
MGCDLFTRLYDGDAGIAGGGPNPGAAHFAPLGSQSRPGSIGSKFGETWNSIWSSSGQLSEASR